MEDFVHHEYQQLLEVGFKVIQLYTSIESVVP